MPPPDESSFRALRFWLLPILFLLLVPVGVTVALLTPTGEQPDEIAHVLRADSVLHGEILGQRRPRNDGRAPYDAGVVANLALLPAGFSFAALPPAQKKITPGIIARLDAVPWADRLSFAIVPNTAVYIPIFYLPAAFGIGLAHVEGFGPHDAIIAARLANLMGYAVLGIAALLLARRARLMIFATLAMPMSLSLAAAVNPDPLIIATAALSAALLTRTGPERWARPLAGIGIAAIIATKPPYVPLALAAFGPLPLRGWTWRQAGRHAIEAALVALPGLIWTALTIALVSVPFVEGPPYHPGPLWPGDPNAVFQTTSIAAQVSVLVHRPSLLLTLPVETLAAGWNNFLETMIGILGLLNILLPDWAYELWEIALLAALAAELAGPRARPRAIRGAGALVIGLAVIATLFAIFLSQDLSWTLVGQTLISGIQGRYFLPLLPFLALTMPPLGSGLTAPIGWLAGLPVAAAAIAGIGLLPWLIVTTFYLR